MNRKLDLSAQCFIYETLSGEEILSSVKGNDMAEFVWICNYVNRYGEDDAYFSSEEKAGKHAAGLIAENIESVDAETARRILEFIVKDDYASAWAEWQEWQDKRNEGDSISICKERIDERYEDNIASLDPDYIKAMIEKCVATKKG